jgi:ribosome-associated protein
LHSKISSQRKALIAAHAALEKHAEGVVVMDLRRLSSVADFFVIATAASHRQLQAITEQVEEALNQRGERVWHIEGMPSPLASRSPQRDDGLSWVLMDCADVVVHLFNPPARMFYQLERLWGDAPRLPLGAVLSD